MDLLLDTATFLWIVSHPSKLSANARQLFQATGSVSYLSPVSAWEIAVKHGKPGLILPRPPQSFVTMNRQLHRIASLPLSEDAALLVAGLPKLHKDPFDRMLVCQAIQSRLTLLTPDPFIHQYTQHMGVRVAW